MIIRICSFALSVLFVAGCRTAPPVRISEVNEGQWRGKALIKEQGRSYIVNLNFNAVKGQQARMDVSSTLGMGVASLLVDAHEVRYVLFDSKRFYYGQPQSDVMRPILAVPLDPRWILNVLFEEPIQDKGWACTRDGGGLLAECHDSTSTTKVSWSARQGEKKTILIEHPKASVQINVNTFRPKVEDRRNLFVLEAPEGYQKLRVR